MGRVLITGASGFVGQHLVATLVQSGVDVRVAVRRPPTPPFPDSVDIIANLDLAHTIDWAPILRGMESVVHLASIAHVGTEVPDSVYDSVNHLATAALAQSARQAGVARFVFLSSVSAQTAPAADHVLTEDDDPRPTAAYGRSKLAAEAAIRKSGVPFTILRPVLVYGPGVKGNLAALARLASLPLPLPFGAFANRRSLLGVDNLIEAIRFVLGSSASRDQTYLVADPSPVSIADIITLLRAGYGRRPGLFAPPPHVGRFILSAVGKSHIWDRLGGELVVDCTKLRTAGWTPSINTHAGLTAMARNFIQVR